MKREPAPSPTRHTLICALRPLGKSAVWSAGILLVWESAGRILQIQPDTLPVPSRIFLEFLVEAERLRTHGAITAAEILSGFFLSVIFSMLTAVLLTLSPSVRRSLVPAAAALRRAPLIAAAPLAFIWLGFGFVSITLLAGVLAFFIMTLGFTAGLGSTSEDVLDLVRVARAGPVRTFMKVRFPACLPEAFVSMRAAVPAVVGAVAVGEFVDGQKGLGYLMLSATFKLQTPFVLATLAILLIIGLALYGTVVFAELVLVRRPRGF